MKVFGCFVFHNFCFVLNIKIAFHLEKNFLNSFHFHESLCTEMGSFPSSLSTCQSKYLKSHVCINMLFFLLFSSQTMEDALADDDDRDDTLLPM